MSEFDPIINALKRRDTGVAERTWLTAALYLERAGFDEAADALRDEVPVRVRLDFRGETLTMGARR